MLDALSPAPTLSAESKVSAEPVDASDWQDAAAEAGLDTKSTADRAEAERDPAQAEIEATDGAGPSADGAIAAAQTPAPVRPTPAEAAPPMPLADATQVASTAAESIEPATDEEVDPADGDKRAPTPETSKRPAASALAGETAPSATDKGGSPAVTASPAEPETTVAAAAEATTEEVEPAPVPADAQRLASDRSAGEPGHRGTDKAPQVEAAPPADTGAGTTGDQDDDERPGARSTEAAANDEPAIELPKHKLLTQATAAAQASGGPMSGPAPSPVVDGATATQLAALEARANALAEAPAAVTLTGEELGGDVDVRLRRIASGLHVHLEPSKTDQATKLASSLTAIRRMLARRGITAGRVSISRERLTDDAANDASAPPPTDTGRVEGVRGDGTGAGGER